MALNEERILLIVEVVRVYFDLQRGGGPAHHRERGRPAGHPGAHRTRAERVRMDAAATLQALAIYVEFNDRYAQASTYHQLGRVAEAQRQWAQAREYLLKDLGISFEFKDTHGAGITLGSLARLYQAAHDNTLPSAVAVILDVSPDEAQSLLAQSS